MSSTLYRQYVQSVHVVAALVGLLVFASAFVAICLVTYGSLYGVTSFFTGVCAALIVGIGSWVTSPRGPVLD